jgi:acyl carrier protein
VTTSRDNVRRATVLPNARPAVGGSLSTLNDLNHLLDATLGLQGRARTFDRQTPLLGALPEFDSMAAVAVLAALEERFGIVIHDDEVDGAVFATVGSLCDFVDGKVARH